VVISQRQPETSPVFEKTAKEKNVPLYFAEDFYRISKKGVQDEISFEVTDSEKSFFIEMDLKGNYQQKNLAGILQTIDSLAKTWI
jgi:dihydrofolate synthase / folylpolyglutamate synthase